METYRYQLEAKDRRIAELESQVRGSQEMADEKCKHFYERAVKAEAKLAEANRMWKGALEVKSWLEAERIKLTEALTLAKGYMRHLDWCGLVRHHDPPYCDCGHTAAMERVVLALPRPTVVVECGDK